jgi:hypothetical protein
MIPRYATIRRCVCGEKGAVLTPPQQGHLVVTRRLAAVLHHFSTVEGNL